MEQLIYFDPSLRPTADQALAHPWLSTYHDENDEPSCANVFDRWRQIEKLETLDEYRDALAKEVKDCRKEMRTLAATSPSRESRFSISSLEEPKIDEPVEPPKEKEVAKQAISPEGPVTRARRGTLSRRTSIEPTVPEDAVAFPSTHDPVVAYHRRSLFGMPSRTSSTFSVHRAGSPSIAEGQESSTVTFPTTEYVVPGRHRTASMYTIGGSGSEYSAPPEMRRLLRTLSTVSIYESGEGHAGGLADVAPIGKYIVQNDRTGDEAVASEMPREIRDGNSGSGSAQVEKGSGGEGKRRFRV